MSTIDFDKLPRVDDWPTRLTRAAEDTADAAGQVFLDALEAHLVALAATPEVTAFEAERQANL